jgi:ubiquinone/menaquinone biosynthesis C-methylase UbiE
MSTITRCDGGPAITHLAQPDSRQSDLSDIARSAYDALAFDFERQRALPADVPLSVRSVIRAALSHVDRPCVLDLGAGTGRFGWPFVAAGDDYVGADLSSGMLRIFAKRYVGHRRPSLVQADGRALPFPAACFDAVLLIAVFADLLDGRLLVDEARRVLRPGGTIALGRTALPNDGIDVCLREHLDSLLNERLLRRSHNDGRRRAAEHLAAAATASEMVVASWVTERCPRRFLERRANGARFRQLPMAVREDTLRALAVWAEMRFGSLDATFVETHRFEMQLFKFQR